ncbi:MAG: InlB B-repeat-containing protein, partial [Clostridia bacterium]|nr:InlB B-repeat-containing protein [Clostridia bacterium]
MLAKSKIISIILTIIFCVSAITCGIVFGVSKSKPQTGAVRGTETSLEGYIGNLLTSSGKVNKTTYNSLISKVGAIGSVSSTQNSASINSGTPVVFQMGTAGGNPVYWQVTYRTKDYITVMMTRPYTKEHFNYDGATHASGVFAGATKTDYDLLGNYSRSTLRQATQQIYTDMNRANSVLSQIVVSPSAMASATSTNWQYSSTQQPDSQFGIYYSHHNALYSYSGSYYSSWTWDKTVYSDMFWIPSYYEVYNSSTSSKSFNGGLWGLSSQSYVGFETVSFLHSGVTASYCWLRSGNSISDSGVVIVSYSGSSSSSGGGPSTHGVRPAAHLSLSSIASFASKTVTFNLNGGSECVSMEIENGDTYVTLPTPTKTGYTFAGWYKSSDLSGNAVSTSDIVTEDHTLYAKWTPNTYYIEYNGNNATSGNMSVSTHTYDTAKALTTNTYTRTGYSFLGWSTSSTATTATYTNGQSVTNLTSTNGGLIV